jgi:putative NADPH-quinone reductase
MRVHFVYAHPVPTSFTSAVHDRILAGLKTQAHQIDELDLYAARFNPVLSLEERAVYLKSGDNLAGIEDYVERLRIAEALVLCFPTWWYGMPAILKGWFDRIWIPGVAFHFPESGGPIKRGLTNIRKLAVVTTYGAPWWFMFFYLREPGKAVLMRGLARLIAPALAPATSPITISTTRRPPAASAFWLALIGPSNPSDN